MFVFTQTSGTKEVLNQFFPTMPRHRYIRVLATLKSIYKRTAIIKEEREKMPAQGPLFDYFSMQWWFSSPSLYLNRAQWVNQYVADMPGVDQLFLIWLIIQLWSHEFDWPCETRLKKKNPWDHLSILAVFKVCFSMMHEEKHIKYVWGRIREDYEEFGKIRAYRRVTTHQLGCSI